MELHLTRLRHVMAERQKDESDLLQQPLTNYLDAGGAKGRSEVESGRSAPTPCAFNCLPARMLVEEVESDLEDLIVLLGLFLGWEMDDLLSGGGECMQ